MAEKWTVEETKGGLLEVSNVETVQFMNSDKHVRFQGALNKDRVMIKLDRLELAYSDHADVVWTPPSP